MKHNNHITIIHDFTYKCEKCNNVFIGTRKTNWYSPKTYKCGSCGGKLIKGRVNWDINKINAHKKKQHDKTNKKKKSNSLFLSKDELTKQYKKQGYPKGWTIEFRRSIRNIDNGMCVICGKTDEEEKGTTNFPSLSIHHINGIKKDLNIWNLITVCNHCHIQEIHKNKQHTKKELIEKIQSKRRNKDCILRIIEHEKKFNS